MKKFLFVIRGCESSNKCFVFLDYAFSLIAAYMAERELRTQEIVQSELESLRPDAKVYKRQPNSNVFFLTVRQQALSDCKKSIVDLKRTIGNQTKSIPRSQEGHLSNN